VKESVPKANRVQLLQIQYHQLVY